MTSAQRSRRSLWSLRVAVLVILLLISASLPACLRRDRPTEKETTRGTAEQTATPTEEEQGPNKLLGPAFPATGKQDVPVVGKMAAYKTPQGSKIFLAIDHDPWADAVVSFKPGNPAATRSTDPWGAVGKPDYLGKDDAADERRYVALGNGGELVLEFIDNVLVDGPGPDLVIFEIGPAVEPTDIAISEDGKQWIEVGRAGGSKAALDIGPFVKPGQRFRFVRLTDAKAGLSNASQWPGADIDAVGALNSLPVPDAPSRAEIEARWKR